MALLPSFQSQIVRMIIPSLPEAELKTLCQSSFHRAAHSSERAKPLDFRIFKRLCVFGKVRRDDSRLSPGTVQYCHHTAYPHHSPAGRNCFHNPSSYRHIPKPILGRKRRTMVNLHPPNRNTSTRWPRPHFNRWKSSVGDPPSRMRQFISL